MAALTLSEMFDRLFKLIGKTWVRGLVLGLIILVPPAIVFIFGMQAFFSKIGDLIELGTSGEDMVPGRLIELLVTSLGFMVGAIVFMLGSIAARLAVTIIGCEESNGRTIAWEEALRRTFSIRFVRLIGTYLIVGLVVVGVIAIPYLAVIAGAIAKSVVLIIVGVLGIFIGIGAVIYLTTKWAFTVPVIGWEEAGVVQSLRRSWELVEGNWWRVFGILLLMNLLMSFAVSLVMTPVYLLVMWDLFSSYFRMLGSMASNHVDPTETFKFFSLMGPRMAIVSGITAILEMLVSPLYVVVLYFDLRSRKEILNNPAGTDEVVTVA